MAYQSEDAKAKAIAVKQKEVEKLEAKVANQSSLLARTQRALSVAQADLDHRIGAPVVPPLDVLAGL
jgi:hypothetical protein